jgi:DNA-binding NarL/FixJ family response regulator
VSIIKLLITKSETESWPIEASNFMLHDIKVCSVDWDVLIAATAIDVDVMLIVDNSERDMQALIRHLRNIAPASKIIVKLHDSSQAIAYFQAGVTGLLDSCHNPERLAEIIRDVCLGEYYLDQATAQLLAMRQIKKMLEPFSALSSREFDVFCLLAEGCSLQSISAQLGVNSKTVSNCQTLIKLKLNLDSKQAIENFAQKHGLIKDKRV